MAKQTFTTGQVLTAAQMNSLQANDYNWTTSAQTASYVLTAANAGQTVTMTNAAATTITVNTGLFSAGDTVRIINLGAGTTTITAGTATVSSAGSLALSQYAAGTLWFSSASAAIFIPDNQRTGLNTVISETSFSSASSVSVNNCFTSAYTNYLLIVNCTASSNQTALRMRVSGTDSTTGYYWANFNYDSNNTGTSISTNVNSSSNVIGADEFYCAVTIYSPQLAQKTIFDAHGVRWLTGRADAWFTNGRGAHDVATAYDGFTLFPFSGTMTGRYTLYGYGKL